MSYISLQKDIIMQHLSGWNPIRLAIFEGEGTDKHCIVGYERAVREYLSVIYERVSPSDVRNGLLKNFDTLIIPGGSASAQAKSLQDEGLKAIRDYVREGGGYVGFCAGAYLAMGYGPDKLDMIAADLVDGEHWDRGKGMATVEFNEIGKAILGDFGSRIDIYYENGPILSPDDFSWLPKLRVLATYQSEIKDNKEARSVMVGSPAVVSSNYGMGRVICFSPHPELTCDLGDMVLRAVMWAKRQPEEEDEKEE
jgi:glutamine amidotransferase-like uncharacterized protein